MVQLEGGYLALSADAHAVLIQYLVSIGIVPDGMLHDEENKIVKIFFKERMFGIHAFSYETVEKLGEADGLAVIVSEQPKEHAEGLIQAFLAEDLDYNLLTIDEDRQIYGVEFDTAVTLLFMPPMDPPMGSFDLDRYLEIIEGYEDDNYEA